LFPVVQQEDRAIAVKLLVIPVCFYLHLNSRVEDYFVFESVTGVFVNEERVARTVDRVVGMFFDVVDDLTRRPLDVSKTDGSIFRWDIHNGTVCGAYAVFTRIAATTTVTRYCVPNAALYTVLVRSVPVLLRWRLRRLRFAAARPAVEGRGAPAARLGRQVCSV